MRALQSFGGPTIRIHGLLEEEREATHLIGLDSQEHDITSGGVAAIGDERFLVTATVPIRPFDAFISRA